MSVNMAKNVSPVSIISVSVIIIISLLSTGIECGLKQWMDAWSGGGGWESKGITLGLKSKGMTAIIPFPLPIPIFSKEKKSDSNGGGNGNSNGGSMKGGSSGGWET